MTPLTLTFGHGAGKDVTHAIPDGSRPSSVKSETSGDVIKEFVPPVISLCGQKFVPDVVEPDVDRRASTVAGTRVCGTCSRLIAEGKTDFPKTARGENPPAKKVGTIVQDGKKVATIVERPVAKKKADPKKKGSNGSKPRTTAKKAVRSTLSDADEKKLQRVAKKLEAEQKIPAAGVVTVGRKLVKFHRGLRSSRPVLSGGIKREHVETIEIALGLVKKPKDSKTAA